MADETAYAAKLRREAAAEECIMVILNALTAFFDGKANLQVGGVSIRFRKDETTQA